MPCNCFGKRKDSKKISSNVPYGKGYVKAADEGDLVSKNKNSYLSPADGCPKLESYLNDSSVSKSNTPSTAPAVASSRNSSLSTSPSASPASYRGALLRSELAEKRKEFFRDYFVVEEGRGGNSATLPAPIRVKNFGDSRPLRPVSQPNSLSSSPLPPQPPGPHLLRPVSPQTKIDNETFASPVFLNELRTASEEISRRWQMSDEERDTTPCSLKGKVKVFPVTYIERQYSETPSAPPQSDFPEINTNDVEFPKINFNTEYPEFGDNADQELICLREESPGVHVYGESPEIEITQFQLINFDNTYPDIKMDTESQNICINEEYNSLTQTTTMPLDLLTSAVGNETSSGSALNFPEGGHQPPFPTIDATPRITETNEPAAQIIDHDVVTSSETNVPELSVDACNIPLRQEPSRPSDGSDAAGEEDSRSSSSDEMPEDIPHQAWQEDEIRPLIEDDELPSSALLRDASPNIIDN